MKAWTHRVLCNETKPSYGDRYDIKAVQDKDGNWRCAERELCGIEYGQVLTDVRVSSLRNDTPANMRQEMIQAITDIADEVGL